MAELAALTDEIRGLRHDVQAEQHTRERQVSMTQLAVGLVTVFGAVGLAVSGFLILRVWQQADQIVADRTTGRVVACQRENASKADTRAGFDRMITMLGALGEQTPERVQMVARFRTEFFAGLPSLTPRDCSPDAVNRAAEG